MSTSQNNASVDATVSADDYQSMLETIDTELEEIKSEESTFDFISWVQALNNGQTDVGFPPTDTEWSYGFLDEHPWATDQHPELEHLTAPEAGVLLGMDESTTETLLDILRQSDGPDVRRFREEAAKA